jgi:hypothetical protein
LTSVVISIDTPQPANLYRVLNYSELPKEFGYTTQNAPSGSNFGYVDVHIPGLTPSSISNTCTLANADIIQHRAMQHANGGKTLNQIMTWFYGSVLQPGDKPTRPYWYISLLEARWGCILFTGNVVMVDEIATLLVKVPNSPDMRYMEMGRVRTFTRNDWGKMHASHPWLIHQATAERWDGTKDVHNPTPGGAAMFSPLWSPADFGLKPGGAGVVKEYWAYMATLAKV